MVERICSARRHVAFLIVVTLTLVKEIKYMIISIRLNMVGSDSGMSLGLVIVSMYVVLTIQSSLLKHGV